jgi:hypothetical protein
MIVLQTVVFETQVSDPLIPGEWVKFYVNLESEGKTPGRADIEALIDFAQRLP